MNTGTKLLLTGVAVAAIVAVAMWAVDVDVTGDLELPQVVADVDVRGGEMPKVDVDTVDVNVSSEKVNVPYPDVDVDGNEATFEVPTLDIDGPEEDTYAEEDNL